MDLPTFGAAATLCVESSATLIENIRAFCHQSKHCENTGTSRLASVIVCFGVHAIFALAQIWVAKRIVVKTFAVELETVCFFAFARSRGGWYVLE